ncbi:ABC transporter substrate-binding protein, partial [Butyricicoccus sp. 1XD8-22]
LDKYTVKVNFNRPDPNILAQLAGLMIISKDYFESIGEERFSKEPSGTGPFKFKQWDREAGKVHLERNNDYWAGKADIEVLEFHA